MYAVVETGGKQYKVESNQLIKVEKLEGEAGKTIKLDKVLALGTEKEIKIGTPVVKDAVVSAEIVAQEKADKVIVFKKKRRHNYRRKKGHRQEVTVLRIMDVSGKGEVVKKAAAKTAAKPASKEEAPEAASKETKPAAKAASAKKTAETKKAPAKEPAAKKTTTKKEG